MSAVYRVLSHTADTGIEATGPNLGAAIAAAAFGMFDLMYDLAHLRPRSTIEVEVTAENLDDLVVDTLADLLFESEAGDVVLCSFDVDLPEARTVHVTAGVVPADAAELRGPPIKAVTYHDLAVVEDPEGWTIRVIFDV